MSQEDELDDKQEQIIAEQTALANLPQLSIQALPTRYYLEQTVIDQLQDALQALSRERPKNPVEFFSYYLLTKHCKKQKQQTEQ